MGSGSKIGIAVIGLGRIGESHLDAIRLNSEAAYVVAVVDIDKSRAQSTAERYKTNFYLSVEEALKDPNIQAAVVCLPHHLHKPVSCQIMETGRHILVEKIWATNLIEGKEMLKTAKKNEVVLMAGQSFRFMWAMMEAKQRIVKGEIGNPFDIIYVEGSAFDKNLAPPWWRELKKTGGMLFALGGSHIVDYILWIYEGRKPVRVYSEARSINPDFEGMDEIIITLRFDDDSMATAYLSTNVRPPKHECLIVGTKGRIDVSYSGGHTPGKLIGVFSSALSVNGELVRSDSPAFHQFAVQMREFLQAIAQKREPMVKHSELITQLTVLEAAQKSVATHRPVLL